MKNSKRNIIKIGNRIIGNNHPCFIIAEAGANWKYCDDMKKNFKHALRLIDIAAKAKADCVKFQIYRASRMYNEMKSGYIKYLGKKEKVFQTIKKLEVPYDWLSKLKKYCDNRGILFLATPFDEESADELDRVGVKAFKIASYTITHIPLLRHIAKKKKPIILSTGGSNEKEVEEAIKAVRAAGNNEIILMQCTASYPAPLESINLRVIPALKNRFKIPVGLSDHSREPFIAPLGAVALGANAYEVHYTTDNKLEGPDHGFAILPHELEQVVKSIRGMEKALGSGLKVMQKQEALTTSFCRRSIYVKRDIKKGKKLTKENIHIVRHGEDRGGLLPKYFDEILGKKARRNLKKDEALQFKDVEL